MNNALKEQLMAVLSRKNIDLVTLYIEDNPNELLHLIELIISHENRAAMRAAWVLEKLIERRNINVLSCVNPIIEVLNDIPESGTRRIVAKILMLVPIAEENEGYVLDFCMNMLESPKEPVAVKANCMTVVFNLLPKYPELKDELYAIIEDQIPYNSVGFKSRFNVLKRKFKMK